MPTRAGEHAHSHLAPPGRRPGSVDHLQPVGTAEAPDLDNPVARLSAVTEAATSEVRQPLAVVDVADTGSHSTVETVIAEAG